MTSCVLIQLQLLLPGCSENAVSTTPALRVPPPAPDPVQFDGASVRGAVHFEDRPSLPTGLGPPALRPARGVLVLAVDARGSVKGSARTDAQGTFSVLATVPRGESFTIHAVADVEYRGHQVRVLTDHPAGRPHEVQSEPIVAGPAPARVELVAPASTVGGAFNVMDVTYEALVVLAAGLPERLPPLTVAWEQGRSRPCTSCYRDFDESIHLGAHPEDTDEYDDDIILHELAHYFARHTHADDSRGGAHRDRRVSPALAYAEGLAYFISCLVRGSPQVVDTYRSDTRVWDFERVTLGGAPIADAHGTAHNRLDGDLREEIPGSILWDVADTASPDEPFDRVTLDRDQHLRLLFGGVRDRPGRGPKGIDLSDYLDALVCDIRLPAADVLELARSRGFPWTAPGC